MLDKTKAFASKHKFLTAIIVIAVIIAAYFIYKSLTGNKSSTSYVTSTVANGTITTSVSGSGQVSPSDSISLQFKASGDLVYLPIQNGQNVTAGQLLAQLDTTDAEKTVRDAQASLDAAQIALQKLEGPSTLAVPQNKQDAINTLNQDYQSGYNTVSSVFTDLPTVMTDLQTVVYGNTFSNFQQNIDYYTDAATTYDSTAPTYKNTLVSSYQTALTEYTKNFSDYKSTTRFSDNTTIDSIITETYNTTKDIAQALKDTNNLIQFYKNTFANYNLKTNPIADTQLATVNADGSKTNSDLVNLLGVQNTLTNDETAVTNSDLDLQSQQLSLQNAQNALQDAKDNLADYYIYAPFDGTIGKLSVQNLASVGSGTSIATLVTTQKICVIPLNEVDVSKVQAGQDAVLTFDALPDLTVAGKVATIDPVGTVSQGVVTYNVEISFDTQDTRVKTGMSISANIITNVKQNVLLVPNAAIKTQGAIKYVQVLVNNMPQQKIVTTGLSNDTNTEIVSGLNAGDKVITQTITTGPSTTATSSSSSLRIPGLTGGGLGGGGGGFARPAAAAGR